MIRLNRTRYSAVLILAFASGQAWAQPRLEVVVVNAASFERGFPVAPGCWATAFGDFASIGVTEAFADRVPLPTQLAGVEVLVNDVRAPLSYVGGRQINFLVPKRTPEQPVPFEIRLHGQPVHTSTLQVWSISPALISWNPADPTRPGAVLNEDNTLNGPDRPARRGEVIQIFGVGAAYTDLPEPDGSPAPSDRLIPTVYTPQVFVSVVEAEVLFSGLAPGWINLWQVNARVPDQPFIRGLVPLVVRLQGLTSNVVSIWVAE